MGKTVKTTGETLGDPEPLEPSTVTVVTLPAAGVVAEGVYVTRTGDPGPFGKTVKTTGEPLGDPDPLEPSPTVMVVTLPAGVVAEGV